jgi:hypothetical protein
MCKRILQIIGLTVQVATSLFNEDRECALKQYILPSEYFVFKGKSIRRTF